MPDKIRELTDEERATLVYFFQEKGDPTRWTGWAGVRPILEVHHQDLLHAYQNLKDAQSLLDKLVREL